MIFTPVLDGYKKIFSILPLFHSTNILYIIVIQLIGRKKTNDFKRAT